MLFLVRPFLLKYKNKPVLCLHLHRLQGNPSLLLLSVLFLFDLSSVRSSLFIHTGLLPHLHKLNRRTVRSCALRILSFKIKVFLAPFDIQGNLPRHPNEIMLCSCSWTPNSSCFLPMLHIFGYWHLKQTHSFAVFKGGSVGASVSMLIPRHFLTFFLAFKEGNFSFNFL